MLHFTDITYKLVVDKDVTVLQPIIVTKIRFTVHFTKSPCVCTLIFQLPSCTCISWYAIFSAPIGQGYGLTETCAGGTFSEFDDLSVGRVGAPLPCSFVKVSIHPPGSVIPY